MSWEAIGAIGESIGAAALVLVLVQLRNAREEMRRSVRSERTGIFLKLMDDMRQPDRVALRARVHEALGSRPSAGFSSVIMERTGITREEAMALGTEQLILFQYYAEKVIRYIDELSPADRFQAEAAMRQVFGGGHGRIWFDETKRTLNPDAVAYLEKLLEDEGPRYGESNSE